MTQAPKQQNGKQSERHRPAMVESTGHRALLYNRLSALMLAVFYVLLLFMSLSLPIFGKDKPSPLHYLQNRGYLQDVASFTDFDWQLFLVMFVFGGGAAILRTKARRHAQTRFVNLESPPGVLFLRPFAEDTDWKLEATWGRDMHWPTFLQPKAFLALWKFRWRMAWWLIRRLEPMQFGEILSELTRSFGNMAAIGEPESPPILGADNVYVSDEGWQEQVLEMARGAKLVILTVGTSPGVMWETQNMLRIVPPLGLLLNVPGMTRARRRKHYAAFREAAEDLFPRGLPKELKARALTFKDDWSPVEVARRQPPPGTSAHVAWMMSHLLR